jgi:hypothetical protein
MKRSLALAGLLALLGGAAATAGDGPGHSPQYTAGGELVFPSDYRDWAYISSGLAMSYAPFNNSSVGPMFDNVFVARESMQAFRATGHWPDPTTFVIEVRGSSSHGSINKSGSFQSELVSFDVEVKDASRPGTWRYYSFDASAATKPASAAAFPQSAGCFECHAKHGAVEHTFVQFYPALLPIARAKGTVNASYHDS